ncbi:MAG: hypothetical protein CMJ42_02155 [Phyllobacteriaceae bacterium]|nr:hypothetical protein [Phyllobacteriaceae bacterium]MBA90362.1 hypothetical protein [Phyllobacteriaceae bacterium]
MRHAAARTADRERGWTRRATVLALFLAMAAAFPASLAPSHALPAQAAQVYFFRGFFGGAFSRGLDDIAGRLAQQGITARVFSWREKGDAQNEILSSTLSGPIIFVGHSFGANAALSLASDLAARGVPISLVVTMDPTLGGPVSPSVGRYRNYYLSVNALVTEVNAFGKALDVPDGMAGRVENIDIRDRTDITYISESHWNMTENWVIAREVHSQIIKALR